VAKNNKEPYRIKLLKHAIHNILVDGRFHKICLSTRRYRISTKRILYILRKYYPEIYKELLWEYGDITSLMHSVRAVLYRNFLISKKNYIRIGDISAKGD